MKNYVLAALLLISSGTFVIAQDLESKQEQRGQTGKPEGSPKAKPTDNGLDQKQEQRGQTGKPSGDPETFPVDDGDSEFFDVEKKKGKK